MTPPALSVVLPVRNGERYLATAIAGVLAQTFHDFELLVVDDGSTDATLAWLARLDDLRVRVMSTGGQGLAAALNLGLAEARGRYLARHDADDWSAPERFARQVAWLDAHPETDVLATAAAFVDADGAPLDNAWTRTVHAQWDVATDPDQIARLLPLTCCIFHATVMTRPDVLRDAGGYDAATVPAEDYDLWLRLLPNRRFARLPERLYTVRTYAESFSARRRADQTERVIEAKLRAVRRWHPALPWPACLGLPCDDRGAEVYRRVGPALGFVPMPTGDRREPDLVAVTDFTAVPAYAEALAVEGEFHQAGNLFVRRRDLARGGGAVAPPAQSTPS